MSPRKEITVKSQCFREAIRIVITALANRGARSLIYRTVAKEAYDMALALYLEGKKTGYWKCDSPEHPEE